MVVESVSWVGGCRIIWRSRYRMNQSTVLFFLSCNVDNQVYTIGDRGQRHTHNMDSINGVVMRALYSATNCVHVKEA